MMLAKASLLSSPPQPVVVKKLTVALGVLPVDRHVFGPQQLQGNAFDLQGLMDSEAVRFNEPRVACLWGEERPFEGNFTISPSGDGSTSPLCSRSPGRTDPRIRA